MTNDVDKYDFVQRTLASRHFFAAQGDSGTYIVSAKFQAAIEQANLQALSFGQLRGYPTPGRSTG